MSGTPTYMYPLTREEREAVRRSLDPEPLDLAFLQAMSEVPNGGVTRKDLEMRVAALPKVAAAVPRWLASARNRRLIERDVRNHEARWRMTALGKKRLADLTSNPRVQHIKLSKPVRS